MILPVNLLLFLAEKVFEVLDNPSVLSGRRHTSFPCGGCEGFESDEDVTEFFFVAELFFDGFKEGYDHFVEIDPAISHEVCDENVVAFKWDEH